METAFLFAALCGALAAGLLVVGVLTARHLRLRQKHVELQEFCREVEDKAYLPEQIQVSKKQLETVFDAITDFICIIDEHMRIVRVNKSYAGHVKQPIRRILGQPCYKVFWSRSSVCDDCPAKESFADGKQITKRSFSRKNVDEVLHFEASTYPVLNEDTGGIVHVVEHIRDVTEERRMVEQLIRSEKLASIGIMTAGIAHEMNNPLSGISGTAVNMLQMPEKYGLNDKGINRVTTILESAARATAIMKDLLHLSRKHDSTRVLVDINATIVKTLNAIHIPGIADVEKRFSFEDTLPPLTCDVSKIEQVIINVVTNALQSIQEKRALQESRGREFHGRLLISTQRQGDAIVMTVTDNGTGIPENLRSKIFDPFFSTRPPGQGTGLGLSICHRIVEEHGGRIFFECIDELTVFSVVLPIERKLHLERSVH